MAARPAVIPGGVVWLIVIFLIKFFPGIPMVLKKGIIGIEYYYQTKKSPT
jgi:hypothetical protein